MPRDYLRINKVRRARIWFVEDIHSQLTTWIKAFLSKEEAGTAVVEVIERAAFDRLIIEHELLVDIVNRREPILTAEWEDELAKAESGRDNPEDHQGETEATRGENVRKRSRVVY